MHVANTRVRYDEPVEALRDHNVRKFSTLPHGWRFISDRAAIAPSGWQWAHNDLNMFSAQFELGLVRIHRDKTC